MNLSFGMDNFAILSLFDILFCGLVKNIKGNQDYVAQQTSLVRALH